MFASCGYSLKLHSWPEDLLEDKSEYVPQIDSRISHMSWCNDNTYMAILQHGHKPQILATKDLSNMRVVHTINLNNVSSIIFKHNTKRFLAAGTNQGEVVIYDTKARQVTKCFSKLVSPIEIIDFSADDQQLGVSCDDSVVIFRSNADGDSNNEYKLTDKCTALKFHPNIINKLAVGCNNGYVTIWDSTSSTKTFSSQLHSQSVSGLSLSTCGNILITVGRDHKICVTDLNSGECQFRINLNLPISSLDLRFDDKIIAVGLEDGSLCLYDMNFSVQPLLCTKPHNSSVEKITFANGVKDCFDLESKLSTITTICRENALDQISKSVRTEVSDTHTENFNKMKAEVMKMIKLQAEDLENQLNSHCQKFQIFINNEFKMINEVIKDKWDVFNGGDINKIMRVVNDDMSDALDNTS